MIYTYQNESKAIDRNHNDIHFGTIKLLINDDASTLIGSYWVDRGSTGHISLSK
ncbi:MAG: hypothetical protein HEQ28_01010 [Prevotella sp.]